MKSDVLNNSFFVKYEKSYSCKKGMTIEKIQSRTKDLTFNCKSIQIEPKALAITIVAFANADDGTIVIGVSDNN
ncbi:putative toxin-antitoxin system, toxin component, Fic family [Segatella salivae DSM 15606]|uniref:Putative toxin-antitoxin system, toxin component, Fic family n=1 Tax=Segatella salivae DSM 15606 TaxID=888832 RepID=E6MQS2_9BACT|nr:putative toxin-antitoxin system, toxin component, Fic family [Segatella salivae DSM 15606]